MPPRSMLAQLVGRLRSRQHASRQSLRDESYPQFYVRQLEQRRVLTVVVDAGADQQGIDEGESFTLDQVTFHDTEVESNIDAQIESVEQNAGYSAQINWGDGTTSAGTVGQGTVTGTHTYADNGVYDVTVIVTDPQNQQGQDSLRVTVDNVDPVLNVSGDDTIAEGSPLELVGTFTDPGFDNLDNPVGEQTESFFYSIDWGDGSAASFGAATVDTPGEPGTPTAGSFTGSHVFTSPGTYTVNVTVFDDDGGSDSQMFDVNVENIVPDVSVMGDETVDEGSPLAITGTFTDPVFGDSDAPPSVTEAGDYTYTVDWGDGTDDSTGIVTDVVPGEPGGFTEGSFDASHIYADNGIYTVTVMVTDPDGGTGTTSFSVTVHNVSPTLDAIDDRVINEGDTLTIPDVGRFTDPGFDNPLNVGGEIEESFFYSIDWGDGGGPSFGAATVDTPGEPGTPTAGSFDGSHLYAGNGVYTVTVTVFDDDGGSDSQTFQVTVQNAAPILETIENQETLEGSTLDVMDITFTDAFSSEGDYTYTVDWGDGTDDSMGTVTDVVPGEPTEGSFDASHVYADNGVYTVTVMVTDPDGGTGTTSFSVMVHNVSPTLDAIDDRVINEGDTLTIPDVGRFTDPGFDNPLNVGGEIEETFFYSIDWGDGSGPSFGAATVDTPGEPGTPTAGSFDGSHQFTTPGTYTVTVTVFDDDGGSDSETFEVIVNNTPPVVFSTENQTIDEGSPLVVTDIGQFTAIDFGGLASNFSYTIDWGDGTTPSDSGSATIDMPPGADGVLAGSFNGSHTYADNGVYTVTLTVMDDVYGDVGSSSLQVTVNNVSPVFVNVAGNQLAFQNELIDLEDIGVFTDPGFDNPLNVTGETEETFTYSIDWGDGTVSDFGAAVVDSPGMVGVSTGGSFDGSHAYTAGGSYTVTITVFDDDGGSDVATFTVDVIPITAPPIGALPPPGGALAPIAQPELVITPEYEPTPLATSDSSEYRPRRALSSPVAEKRYVLRVVAVSGKEGEDIPLKDDVLDNLDTLYALLPNDHYRIYEIRTDGSERLVRDFQLRNHQPVDPAEPNEELRDLPASQSPDNGAAVDAEKNANKPTGADADTETGGNANPVLGANPDLGANFDADTISNTGPLANAHDAADSVIDVSQARPLVTDSSWRAIGDSSEQRLARRNPLLLYGGTSLGATAAALAYSRRTTWRTRVDDAMQQAPERRFTKAARIFRRVRPK